MIGDITNPAAFSCNLTMVVVRVANRDGKPLAGYHVHYGQDGPFDKWDPFPTTEVVKEPFGYNSSFSFSGDGSFTVYVSVFRDEVHPFDISQSLSSPGEVKVHIDEKDLAACAASGNRNDGTNVRIAPVVFLYNR
jgi:hypothetical protein